jgi:hypothetical protein
MSLERKTLKFSFSCPAYNCYISATVLVITWTERWLRDGSAEVDQSLGLLGCQI